MCANFSLDRTALNLHLTRNNGEIRIQQLMTEITDRLAYVVIGDAAKGSHRGRIAAHFKFFIEKQGGDAGARQQIIQVVIELRELGEFVLILRVDGIELFIDRLQFLVGALQFFIAGEQFFIGCLQFLVGGFQLFYRRLQIFTGKLQFTFQVIDALFSDTVKVKHHTRIANAGFGVNRFDQDHRQGRLTFFLRKRPYPHMHNTHQIFSFDVDVGINHLLARFERFLQPGGEWNRQVFCHQPGDVVMHLAGRHAQKIFAVADDMQQFQRFTHHQRQRNQVGT